MIRILDIETESHEYLGKKASPYCPENYVVMPGWQDFQWDGTPIDPAPKMQHFLSRDEAETGPGEWFHLDGVQIIVAHNAMFEMSWFLQRYREPFMAFLRRGGRVLCTQLAEYLLSHQVNQYPSLDETAPLYGGTHKVDGVALLWQQGVLTSAIDPALLAEYLIGPEGDIANTSKVFFGQRAKLVAAGMWDMYLERCEALLGYSLCEDAGLFVNREVAERNLAAATAELNEIEAQVQAMLPELPARLEFNWGSRFHLSALVYGGGVKFKDLGPYDPPQYVKVDVHEWKNVDTGESVHLPLTVEQGPPEGRWEVVRYASGKNKGRPKVFRVDSAEEKLKQVDAIFEFPGVVQIAKLPEAVRLNFDPKNGDWCGAQTLGDGTPVYSTAEEVLDVLAKHGLAEAELLARRAALSKDIGTYYRQVVYNKDGSVKEVKGMLQFLGEDSIIHHSLNATATISGRLSSSKPNLQNLPRSDEDDQGNAKSRVKEMFTSRFGDEGVIIEIDYSALEVVTLAAISGDQNLLQKLQDGTDMHCYRLAGAQDNWKGLSYEELRKANKDKSHPRHHEVHNARTNIKPRAFAAQYGATAYGIAYATGCTVEEAQEFLDNEAKLFPESIAFRQVVYNEVLKNGEKHLHREMLPDGSWGVYYRGWWQAPGGTCYSFRQYPQWRDGQKVMDYKPTQIANYWNQGEAGFIMAVSTGRAARYLIANQMFANAAYPDGRAFLVNNVHDANYLDAHKSVAREVALAIKAIMEDAPKYLSAKLGYNISHVPFPAEAEMGPSMFEKERVE